MQVGQAATLASRFDGLTSDQIKTQMDQMSLANPQMGTDLRAMRNLIDTTFLGDARVATDFIKMNGKDPRVASQQIAPFINSGQASSYVQQTMAPYLPPGQSAQQVYPAYSNSWQMALSGMGQNGGLPQSPQMGGGSMTSNLMSFLGAGAQPARYGYGAPQASPLTALITGLVTGGVMAAMNNKINDVGPSIGHQVLGPLATQQIVGGAVSSGINTVASILTPPKIGP